MATVSDVAEHAGSDLAMSDRYDDLIRDYAAEYGLDAQLLKAQIRAESNFDPAAVSHAGAMGLAQFMPGTWQEWGEPGDPFDPHDSIKAQARYMSWLLERPSVAGHVDRALAAYNWGIGRINRYKGNWRAHAPKETRDYVDRILRWRPEMTLADPPGAVPADAWDAALTRAASLIDNTEGTTMGRSATDLSPRVTAGAAGVGLGGAVTSILIGTGAIDANPELAVGITTLVNVVLGTFLGWLQARD